MRHALLRSHVYGWFILVLFVFILHPFKAVAQGDHSGSTDPSRVSIEKLLQDLEDPQRLENLKQDLRVLLQASEASSGETGDESKGFAGEMLRAMSGYMQKINHVLAEVGQNMLQIPDLARDIAGQAQDPDDLGHEAPAQQDLGHRRDAHLLAEQPAGHQQQVDRHGLQPLPDGAAGCREGPAEMRGMERRLEREASEWLCEQRSRSRRTS